MNSYEELGEELFRSTTPSPIIDGVEGEGEVSGEVSDESGEVSDEGESGEVSDEGESARGSDSSVIKSSDNPTKSYMKSFFNLTRIHRSWRAVDDDKTKKRLSTELQTTLTDRESEPCNIESIQLFHDNNNLIIECHSEISDSANIRVKQYRIQLDDKVHIDDEIHILERKINRLNYIFEIEYLRDNLLEYQSLTGKDKIDTYLLAINLNTIGRDDIDKIRKNRSEYPVERDIYIKMIELLNTKQMYDQQIDFLHNYKQIIYVRDELFGKYGTCKGDVTSDDMNTTRVTIPHLELCVQYCQLRYADFLKALTERHLELQNISKAETDKRKAKIFDIIALEKQISRIQSTYKQITGKYNRGDLVKVPITPEAGDETADFLGFVKSHDTNKQTTHISYCNKIINDQLDTEVCKQVNEATFGKDNLVEIVLPILDFLRYYDNTIQTAKQAISSNFIRTYSRTPADMLDSDGSPEGSPETREYTLPNVEDYRDDFKSEMIKSTEFIIRKPTTEVEDKPFEMKKQDLYTYLHDTRDKLDNDIKILCANGTDELDDEIGTFINNYIETVRKEHPIINYNKKLESYVNDYLYRFLTHICNNSSLTFKTQHVNDLRTQKERENELEKKRREMEASLRAELNELKNDEKKGAKRRNGFGDHPNTNNLGGQISGRKGLSNIGNTCFMNSAIQVYSNMTPLRELLFNLHNGDNGNGFFSTVRNTGLTHKYKIINKFIELLKEIWKQGGRLVPPGSIHPFRRLITDRFRIRQQADSGEFFHYMYNILHEYLCEPLHIGRPLHTIEYTSVSILADGSVTYKLDEHTDNELPKSLHDSQEFNNIHREAMQQLKHIEQKSIISKLFNIYEQTTVTIDNCENLNDGLSKIKYEISRHLELKPDDKQDVITIETLLSKYQEKEALDEDNHIKSTKCTETNYLYKQTHIVTLPPILNIKINRHMHIGRNIHKNTTSVNMPLLLNMDGLINHDIYVGSQQLEYNLKSIIWHSGDLQGGHYISWSKQDEQWTVFNDSNASDATLNTETINGVTYIKDGDGDNMQVHMAVYERQDIRRFNYIIGTDGDPKPNLPETDPNLPDPKPNLPETEPNLPETEPILPETKPNIPETEPILPDPKPNLPETEPNDSAGDEKEYEPTGDDISLVHTLPPVIDEGIDLIDSDSSVEVEVEVEYGLVEVIVEYPEVPKFDLPTGNYRWYKYIESEGSTVYYMAEAGSSEPVSLYMVYDKTSTGASESDGSKVPINNMIYYDDNDDVRQVYGYINNNYKEGSKIKDIETRIYNGEYKLNRKA
jgi:ubiquitin C-terminal hydrolase